MGKASLKQRGDLSVHDLVLRVQMKSEALRPRRFRNAPVPEVKGEELRVILRVNHIGLAARQHRGQVVFGVLLMYAGRRQSRIVPRGMPRRREISESLRPASTSARAPALISGGCISRNLEGNVWHVVRGMWRECVGDVAMVMRDPSRAAGASVRMGSR